MSLLATLPTRPRPTHGHDFLIFEATEAECQALQMICLFRLLAGEVGRACGKDPFIIGLATMCRAFPLFMLELKRYFSRNIAHNSPVFNQDASGLCPAVLLWNRAYLHPGALSDAHVFYAEDAVGRSKTWSEEMVSRWRKTGFFVGEIDYCLFMGAAKRALEQAGVRL